MTTILLLGAGRSSSSLIRYLLDNSVTYHWQIVIGDVSESSARERIGAHPKGAYVRFDINEADTSSKIISGVDLVISLLPAALHPKVARLCLEWKKHLLTASYVSEEMAALHAEATSKGLLFLNECGLDPGIDHMSAMQIIDRIRSEGGKIRSFESFTGGLIAPDTAPENPWRYKFTWNPRNVVMAGQGTAKYLEDGQMKYIPYQQLFKRITLVNVPGYGMFEGYANRDSLKYISTYGLQDIETMLRGTLRNEYFCSAWNTFVQLGCCDDSFRMENVVTMTHREYTESFLPSSRGSAKERLAKYLGVDQRGQEMKCLEWSGLFSDEKIGLNEGTPAQLLEHILNKRWKLDPEDKDMVVMWHRFGFELNGIRKEIQASLVSVGETSTYTAMAKTVGLPIGIAAKLLTTGKIKSRGVQIPLTPEFYEPILKELEDFDVRLVEHEL
jgi:saccharopine dehydrogenase-like NADP-dependent oxidoreductase